MTAHSLFSASASERWARCPGSLALAYGTGSASATSYAAAEGTACHEAGELCLRDDSLQVSDLIGTVFQVEDFRIPFTDELADLVQTYVEYVRGLPGTRLVEVRCDYTAALGLPLGQGFGTSDAVLLDGTTVHVVDAKFGRKYVAPEANTQLALYAVGVVATIESMLGEQVDKVVLHIVQPRVTGKGTYAELDRAGLDTIMVKLRTAAQQGLAAIEAYIAGKPILPFLHPGPTQCQWCPARAACPALKLLAEDALTAAPVAKMTEADLAAAMSNVDVLEVYAEAVRAEVIRRCSDGQGVTGWKMVLGREGNRKWADEAAAEKALEKVLPKDKIYTQPKLLSVAQMERALKGTKMDLEPLVKRDPPKPALATADDPRPAWSANAHIADEFEVQPERAS